MNGACSARYAGLGYDADCHSLIAALACGRTLYLKSGLTMLYLPSEFPQEPELCYLNHAAVGPWPRGLINPKRKSLAGNSTFAEQIRKE